MNRKTLLVHAGTHKTGTTSFQRFIAKNQELLIENGVTPIVEIRNGEIDGNCITFAHHIIRAELITIARKLGDAQSHTTEEAIKYFSKLARTVEQAKTKCLLISAEALCFARTSGEHHRLNALRHIANVDIIPIIATRSQDAWRASWRDQILKHPQTAELVTGDENCLTGEWYFDLDSIKDFWHRYSDVRVVDYDQAIRSEGDIIPALLRTMEINLNIDNSYQLNARSTS